jgi:hypothetical protein
VDRHVTLPTDWTSGASVRTMASGAPVVISPGTAPEGHALALLRPEHVSIEEAHDGVATPNALQVIDRLFSGFEILLRLRFDDGVRLGV